ncbi:MAG: ATP-binding cassette domain-containing protein [Bacteroidetes bacterium]|nr:ATP-binding cassette domain-containing protein [Bacteroidota bacterium]
MLEIKQINKSFASQQVLFDISARFEKGQVNLIIGQSGQGKSVLAKCLVGLHEVDSGEILYNGEDFTKMNRNQRSEIRRDIGMLFQGAALFDSLTVEENIIFPLSMFTNMTKAEMLKRADFCLEHVNLVGRNKLFPSECSGGMQKRIGIARAIAMNPKFLFCDEPNSGLDPESAILIDTLIKQLTYELDMTTIVITHDMNSVMEIGDNIMFIYKGQKWWEGSRQSIVTTDNEEISNFVYASNFMKEIRTSIEEKRR